MPLARHEHYFAPIWLVFRAKVKTSQARPKDVPQYALARRFSIFVHPRQHSRAVAFCAFYVGEADRFRMCPLHWLCRTHYCSKWVLPWYLLLWLNFPGHLYLNVLLLTKSSTVPPPICARKCRKIRLWPAKLPYFQRSPREKIICGKSVLLLTKFSNIP
jgi:hypothetical protein